MLDPVSKHGISKLPVNHQIDLSLKEFLKVILQIHQLAERPSIAISFKVNKKIKITVGPKFVLKDGPEYIKPIHLVEFTKSTNFRKVSSNDFVHDVLRLSFHRENGFASARAQQGEARGSQETKADQGNETETYQTYFLNRLPTLAEGLPSGFAKSYAQQDRAVQEKLKTDFCYRPAPLAGLR